MGKKLSKYDLSLFVYTKDNFSYNSQDGQDMFIKVSKTLTAEERGEPPSADPVSGAPAAVDVLYCEVCSIRTTSEYNMMEHKLGRRHKINEFRGSYRKTRYERFSSFNVMILLRFPFPIYVYLHLSRSLGLCREIKNTSLTIHLVIPPVCRFHGTYGMEFTFERFFVKIYELLVCIWELCSHVIDVM